MKIFSELVNVIRALIAISLSFVVLWLVSFSLIVLATLQRACPLTGLKKYLAKATETVALWWPTQSHYVLHYLTAIEWQIEGREIIDLNKNYLVIANHQSWSDIPVLEEALYARTGLSRYFIKKSLLNTPLVGWMCRALEFPAMNRFSKSMLLKDPSLKGKDTESTRQSCLRLKGLHFTLNNFIEGTRFTAEKHRRQQSPYQYLLKPKAGGLSYAINHLHDQVDSILNVTITYIGGSKTLFGVYASRVKKIKVAIEKIPLSADLIGSYEEDREFRVHFQAWLNELWLKKDQQMAKVIARNS